MLCTSGFADYVSFSHNGPNTDTGLESTTYLIIHRDSRQVAPLTDIRRKPVDANNARVKSGSPSNTMWPGPRSTSVQSGVLINPAVWPQ